MGDPVNVTFERIKYSRRHSAKADADDFRAAAKARQQLIVACEDFFRVDPGGVSFEITASKASSSWQAE
jgi:hypothetical protein